MYDTKDNFKETLKDLERITKELGITEDEIKESEKEKKIIQGIDNADHDDIYLLELIEIPA